MSVSPIPTPKSVSPDLFFQESISPLSDIATLEASAEQQQKLVSLLSPELFETLQALFNKIGLHILIVGSQVGRVYYGGSPNFQSDIDILVLVDGRVDLSELIASYFPQEWEGAQIEKKFAKLALPGNIDLTFSRSFLKDCYHFDQCALSYHLGTGNFCMPQEAVPALDKEPGKLTRHEKVRGFTYDATFSLLSRVVKGYQVDQEVIGRVLFSLSQYATFNDRSVAFQRNFKRLVEEKYPGCDPLVFYTCAYMHIHAWEKHHSHPDIANLKKALLDLIESLEVHPSPISSLTLALTEGSLEKAHGIVTANAASKVRKWNSETWNPLFFRKLPQAPSIFPKLGVGFMFKGHSFFIPPSEKNTEFWKVYLSHGGTPAFRVKFDEVKHACAQDPSLCAFLYQTFCGEGRKTLLLLEDLAPVSSFYLQTLSKKGTATAFSRLLANKDGVERFGFSDCGFRLSMRNALKTFIQNPGISREEIRELLLIADKWPGKGMKEVWQAFYKTLPLDSPFLEEDRKRVPTKLGVMRALDVDSKEASHYLIEKKGPQTDGERKEILARQLFIEDQLKVIESFEVIDPEFIYPFLSTLLNCEETYNRVFAFIVKHLPAFAPKYAFELFEQFEQKEQGEFARELGLLEEDQELRKQVDQILDSTYGQLLTRCGNQTANEPILFALEKVFLGLPLSDQWVEKITLALLQAGSLDRFKGSWGLWCLQRGISLSKETLISMGSASFLATLEKEGVVFPYLSECYENATDAYIAFCLANKLEGEERVAAYLNLVRAKKEVLPEALVLTFMEKLSPKDLLENGQTFAEEFVKEPRMQKKVLEQTGKEEWGRSPDHLAFVTREGFSLLTKARKNLLIGTFFEQKIKRPLLVDFMMDPDISHLHFIRGLKILDITAASEEVVGKKVISFNLNEKEAQELWESLPSTFKKAPWALQVASQAPKGALVLSLLPLYETEEELLEDLDRFPKDFGDKKGKALAYLMGKKDPWLEAAKCVWERSGAFLPSEVYPYFKATKDFMVFSKVNEMFRRLNDKETMIRFLMHQTCFPRTTHLLEELPKTLSNEDIEFFVKELGAIYETKEGPSLNQELLDFLIGVYERNPKLIRPLLLILNSKLRENKIGFGNIVVEHYMMLFIQTIVKTKMTLTYQQYLDAKAVLSFSENEEQEHLGQRMIYIAYLFLYVTPKERKEHTREFFMKFSDLIFLAKPKVFPNLLANKAFVSKLIDEIIEGPTHPDLTIQISYIVDRLCGDLSDPIFSLEKLVKLGEHPNCKGDDDFESVFLKFYLIATHAEFKKEDIETLISLIKRLADAAKGNCSERRYRRFLCQSLSRILARQDSFDEPWKQKKKYYDLVARDFIKSYKWFFPYAVEELKEEEREYVKLYPFPLEYLATVFNGSSSYEIFQWLQNEILKRTNLDLSPKEEQLYQLFMSKLVNTFLCQFKQPQLIRYFSNKNRLSFTYPISKVNVLTQEFVSSSWLLIYQEGGVAPGEPVVKGGTVRRAKKLPAKSYIPKQQVQASKVLSLIDEVSDPHFTSANKQQLKNCVKRAQAFLQLAKARSYNEMLAPLVELAAMREVLPALYCGAFKDCFYAKIGSIDYDKDSVMAFLSTLNQLMRERGVDHSSFVAQALGVMGYYYGLKKPDVASAVFINIAAILCDGRISAEKKSNLMRCLKVTESSVKDTKVTSQILIGLYSLHDEFIAPYIKLFIDYEFNLNPE